MSNHGYPRLCGGTFFTLVLQALKQRMKAREHYKGESDGMSDPEVLMGLFKVINPDFQVLDKKQLKGATDGFKSCKAKSSKYLPFGDTQEIRAFDKRVKTEYSDALHDMEAFVDEFIDVGEKVGKHINLVKALADLVIQDEMIKPPHDEFYITPDRQVTKKAAFSDLDEVYLPAFLLGVWHYAVTVRKDNKIGDETYDTWCPSTGGGPRIYIGDMGDGILAGIKVTVPQKIDIVEDPESECDPYYDEVIDEAPQTDAVEQGAPNQTVINNNPTFFNFNISGNIQQFYNQVDTVIVNNGGKRHE